MSFDKFPLDEQRCMFRVGSYSYDSSKMIFIAKSTGYSTKQSNSIALDYEISELCVCGRVPQLKMRNRLI